MQGRVRRSTGSWYEVMLPNGEVVNARAKGKLRLLGGKTTNPIAVGDFVTLQESAEEWNIAAIQPRKNYIIRKASNASRQWHVLGANIDGLVVMASLRFPRTSLGFVDRALVTAEAYSIPAAILFNKLDVYGKKELDALDAYTNMYQDAGYTVITSSLISSGIPPQLEAILSHSTQLIIGHSGVGKSTLLNMLSPELELKTGTISNFSQKGKHTTTFAQMHPVSGGGWVIDTPGIKELGLVDISPAELSHYFPEMMPFLKNCRFNNCIHTGEPGCAVAEAVERNQIHPMRYASYLSMLQDDDQHR